MNTIKFTTDDFKETFDGFTFKAECEGAEERKFAVEALQADGSYQKTPVTEKELLNFLSTVMDTERAKAALKLVVELTDVYTKERIFSLTENCGQKRN